MMVEIVNKQLEIPNEVIQVIYLFSNHKPQQFYY